MSILGNLLTIFFTLGFFCTDVEQYKPKQSFKHIWVSEEFKSPAVGILFIVTDINDKQLSGYLKFKTYDKKDRFLSYEPGDYGSKAKIKDMIGIENIAVYWPKPNRYTQKNTDYMATTNAYEESFILPLEVSLSKKDIKQKRSFVIDYMICSDICLPIEQKIEFKAITKQNLLPLDKVDNINNLLDINLDKECEYIVFKKPFAKKITYYNNNKISNVKMNTKKF